MSKAKLNNWMQAENMKMELVKSDGYFYFVLDDGNAFETSSVYVNAFSHMDYSAWQAEAVRAYDSMREVVAYYDTMSA